jgi:hypothetical protein
MFSTQANFRKFMVLGQKNSGKRSKFFQSFLNAGGKSSSSNNLLFEKVKKVSPKN